MIKLLLARSRLSCGIRQTTGGRAMKVLCEMSSRSRACSSASSSGSLLIWLWLKFSSANDHTMTRVKYTRARCNERITRLSTMMFPFRARVYFEAVSGHGFAENKTSRRSAIRKYPIHAHNAIYRSPVISENLTANFAGIFVITFPERSHLFSSVCRIRW